MGKFLRFFFFAALLYLSFFMFEFAMVVIHEHRHKAIYEDYGIQSEIHYEFENLLSWQSLTSLDPTMIAYTQAVNKSEDSEGCTEFCNLQHNMLEIVDEGVSKLVFFLFMITLVITFYIHFLKDDPLSELEKELKTVSSINRVHDKDKES